MDERERRVVENEARFRLVNERIRTVVSDEGVEDPGDDITVLCECGRAECTETIGIPLSLYEWTRAAPARFVLVPGHELPEFERVVRDDAGYAIVEKIGEAEQLAANADPRHRE